MTKLKNITLSLLLAVSSCTGVSPVTAQEGYEIWGNQSGLPDQLYHRDEREEDPVGSLGAIVHYNAMTLSLGSQEVTVETEYGDFVFSLVNTPNGECSPACPDTVELLSAPDGYTVVPFMLTTPENHINTMHIYEVLGS